MSAQYNAADDYFEADDFDPLHEYEQITGNRLSSYDGPEGLGLAILLSQRKSMSKEFALKQLGDVHGRMTEEEYRTTLERAGFRTGYTRHFTYAPDYAPNDPRQEMQRIMFHSAFGVILRYDTYTDSESCRINSCNWWAAWKPFDEESRRRGRTSSGSYQSLEHPEWYRDERFDNKSPDDLFWFGYWDGREGVMTHIDRLLENGTLFAQWPLMRRAWVPLFISSNAGSCA